MKQRNAHLKLLALLCLVMCATASLVLLAGCTLRPEQMARGASHDQVVEAFDQIVPGMTRADDLPGLGFDTAHLDMLSSSDLARRAAADMRGKNLDPAVRACVEADVYCTGFVFHLAAGRSVADLFGAASQRQSGDIILLVMNGRVIHKVFSGSPPSGHSLVASL
jgi:hypothetical protein